MPNRGNADARLMSVSIMAGPATRALIDRLRGIETKRFAVFEQEPHSSPDEIINRLVAIAEKGETDQLIIECEPDRPPMAYASLFAEPSTPLANRVCLTTVVFAIDAETLLDVLLGRKPTDLPSCFLAEQMEFAGDIFLGDANKSDFELARFVASALNPNARLFPLTTSGIATWRSEPGTPFHFAEALNNAGWRKLLEEESPAPSSANHITAFGYSARRPFHPERFWTWLQRGAPGIFRAKGFFWLATRMDEVGGLHFPGSEVQCASAGHWCATRDPKTREAEMPERTREQWREPFGDRRQSFAVLALGIDRGLLQDRLDDCLLTDDEMAPGEQTWRSLPDPFPSWSGHGHVHHHDHECDHEHEHGEHDCCHH
jgi:G3E family GTPase